ncbi:MAG: hypothetical protein ACRCTJ_00395 [Brevinema sp.]
MRKIIFLFIIVFITSNSYSQSREEKIFFETVSNKILVPLEAPHLSLDFSKDGQFVVIASVYNPETKLNPHFVKMDKDFAVYLLEDEDSKIFLYLSLLQIVLVFRWENLLNKQSNIFILALGKYKQ